MKQLSLFIITAIAFVACVQAQTSSFDKITVRSSIKLGNSTITSVSTDTTFSNESDFQLPTQRAVKKYVDGSPSVKRAGSGISRIEDSIYFGGDFETGFNYNIIQPNEFGGVDYLTRIQADQYSFSIRHLQKYIRIDDGAVFLNGGASQQITTAGFIALSEDGVALGHTDNYTNSGTDLQITTDGSVVFGFNLHNGDASGQFLTTDADGKLILKSGNTSFRSFISLSYATTTVWDLNNSPNANLTLNGNTTLSISNPAPGQEGALIVMVPTAGSVLTFPGNSYQLKFDGSTGGGYVSDTTKVGVVNGANATGKWVCKFLYDGTYYYWTIRRVDFMD